MKSFRRLGVPALAVLLAVCISVPSAAQEQKGTLVFAVESLGAQTLDPILEGRPGNAVYQAVDVRLAGRLRPREGRRRPGVAERWELVRGRPDLDLPSAARPEIPQRRQADRARREVQPGAPDGAELARLGGGTHAAHDQEHRGGRRPDGAGQHQRARRSACRPACQPRGGAGRRDHAQGLHREGRRGGVPQEADRQRPVEVRAQRAGRPHRVHGRRPTRTGAAGRTSRTCTSCWCRRRARAWPWCAPARRRSPRSARRPCSAPRAAGWRCCRCPARCRRCSSSGAPSSRR